MASFLFQYTARCSANSLILHDGKAAYSCSSIAGTGLDLIKNPQRIRSSGESGFCPYEDYDK